MDDVVLTSSSDALLTWIVTTLHREFSLRDLGGLHHFLGVSVTRTSHGMLLSQRQYILDVLDRVGMTDCHPCSTPINTSSKLPASSGPPIANPTEYHSLASAL